MHLLDSRLHFPDRRSHLLGSSRYSRDLFWITLAKKSLGTFIVISAFHSKIKILISHLRKN